MKNVACYCRVSTDEQAKFGFSIQAQKDALEKYCKENNYKCEFFIDEGISASSMKRPALQKMLSKISTFDMILFTKLDRLSRNVLDANTINKILIDNHCTMKAIDEDDIDTSTADGTFIFNLKVSLAQREIGKTSERIKFVFANKREKGEITSGTKIYGYDIVDKRYKINKQEANNIIEFYKYFLKLSGDTIETYNYFKCHFPNTSYDAYKHCLTNTDYIGKHKLYRKNEYIYNYIPPLMDENLFNEVQNVLNKRRKVTKNNLETPFTLFDGILKCGKCNARMTRRIGYVNGKCYVGYRCWKHEKLSKNPNQQYSCDNKKQLSENKIENYLLNNIEQLAKNYVIETKINKAVKISSQIDVNKINSLKRKIEKLKDLYLEDLIDKDTYKKDFAKLNQELAELQNIELLHNTYKEKDLSHLHSLINSDFKTRYNSLSPAEKRRFWINIIDFIYITDGKIERVDFK